MSQKMTKACLKSSDIPLTTFHRGNTQFPIVELSHSAILYLDFSWNINLGPFGTLGGLLGPLQARKQPKNPSNHQIFFCPPSMGLTTNFPTVRSSHSKLFYLDFSWKARSSIWNHWGPQGAVGGPYKPENNQKIPQITRYSFVHLPWD